MIEETIDKQRAGVQSVREIRGNIEFTKGSRVLVLRNGHSHEGVIVSGGANDDGSYLVEFDGQAIDSVRPHEIIREV